MAILGEWFVLAGRLDGYFPEQRLFNSFYLKSTGRVMKEKWKIKIRHWLASVFARLYHRVCEPSELREFAALDDYLRIQRLRQIEEQRYLALYLGPRI
jgi:hypothetical protein